MMKNASVRRQMRLKRDAILRRGPILMLDIGSSKIAAMAVQFSPPEAAKNANFGFRVLASAVRRSDGVKFGELVGVVEFQQDLMRLVQSIQKSIGSRLDYAMVSISGGRPMSMVTTGEVGVEHGEVGQIDIARALSACELPEPSPNREYLHMMPVNFTLDGRTGLTDPRGQIGARLAADMHLVSVDSGTIHAIETAIRGIDLEIVGTTVSGFATGLGVLTEEELKRGAVVVDFGAMVTSVSVYYSNQLMYVENVRLGGNHVSQDLAQAFGASVEVAEKIKTKHGGVIATARDDRDMVDLHIEGASFEERFVSRSEVIGVIRPRVEEILDEIAKIIERAQVDSLPNLRYVITGAAAQIPGLDELAERFFGARVRLGRPLKLSGASAQQENMIYAAVSGLAVFTTSPKDEYWDFVDPRATGSVLNLRSILNWFQTHW